MRSTIIVFILFVGLCCVNGFGYGERRDSIDWESSRDWKDREECDKDGICERTRCDKDGKCERTRCDKDGKCETYKENEDDRKCYDEGVCDYDNERYFYDPCDHPDDVDCVRKFFASYGKCKVVEHEDRKSVYREKYLLFLPKINLTIITTKVRLRNLDGNITRFYINKKTGNLVFAVEFKGIEINSNEGIFIFHRNEKEPVVIKERFNYTIPVTLTAIIPIDGGVTLESLEKSMVTAFLPTPVVKFFLGPRVLLSKDPTVQKSVIGLLTDIPTAFQENFLTEAPNFFLAYLQKYICDFGIPQSSYPNVRGIYQEH